MRDGREWDHDLSSVTDPTFPPLTTARSFKMPSLLSLRSGIRESNLPANAGQNSFNFVSRHYCATSFWNALTAGLSHHLYHVWACEPRDSLAILLSLYINLLKVSDGEASLTVPAVGLKP